MKFLRSKLSVPEPARHFIERPRLVAKICAKSKANIFLLVAPAGYGKTTLAAQALARSPKSAKSWYHLDAQDTDPRRFLAYVIEGLSRAIPTLRGSRLAEKVYSGQAAISEIIDDVCFFFEEYGKPGGWVVVDNWEIVNDQPAITEIVSSLFSTIDANLKFIINSRVKPSFKIRKLQEDGRAVVITEQDLAFNLPEFAQAVAERLQTPVKESQVEEIWRLTAGWCVNLGLILEILQHRGLRQSEDIVAAVKESESLGEYIEEELLRDLDPQFVDFLARCSVLETLSPKSCRTVLGPAHTVPKFLRLLHESDIPHFSLNEKNSFRLHPLIRQAAGRLLRTKTEPHELKNIYTAAADYYREQGRIIEAIDLLMELPDYDMALATIDKEWPRLMETNSRDAAQRWLERFPAESHNHPLYIKTTANILSSSGKNRQLVDYLADKLKPEKFAPGDAVLATLWYQYHWALLHISPGSLYGEIRRRWEKLDASHGPFSGTVAGAVENTLSYAAYAESRIDKAVEHMQNALACQKDIILDRYLTAKNNIAFYKHLTGRSAEALEELEQVIAESEAKGMFIIAPLSLVNIAWIHCSMGRHREAFAPVDRVMEIMYRHDVYNVGLELYVNRIKGLSFWYLGERDRGMELLEKSLEFSANYDQGEHVSTGLSIEYLSLLSGRPRKVVDRKDLPTAECKNENRLFYLNIQAMASIMDGRFARARRSAAELLERAWQYNLVPWAVTGHFLMAYLNECQKKDQECRHHLKEGLAQLEQIGWYTYQMPNDLITGFVLARAVSSDIMPAIAQRLVAGNPAVDFTPAFLHRLEAVKDNPAEGTRLITAAIELKIRGLRSSLNESGPGTDTRLAEAKTAYLQMVEHEALPGLTVKMLGRFSMISRHGQITFTRKKSRLLCQLLLLENPKPVHEEVIIEQFWPESDPAKSRATLRTCVKDLRRALDPYYESRGRSYVEYNNEHYSISLPEDSSVDVWEFKRRLSASPRSHAHPSAQADVRQEDIRKALELYEGDLLPEQQYESFTVEIRERLRTLFQEGCTCRAQSLMAAEDFHSAIDILQRGLRLDPLWAQGVQTLMSAYAKSGEVFRALRLYRTYEKRLEQDLGLPPDREMQNAFVALSSGYYAD